MLRDIIKPIALLACIVSLASSSTLASAKDLEIIGWIEEVSLHPYDFRLKAKIDTGADNSSIDAAEWHEIQRDGQDVIQFQVRSNDGRVLSLEAPLLRFTEVKRKGADPVTRPVVNLYICIGNTVHNIPVNIADRSNFQYRMLVGRSALSGKFLVDSAKKYLSSATCR